MTRALRGCPVAVIDTETTGIDPTADHVVEVAVVHALLGDTAPEIAWAQRVRPPVPVPAGASAAHGITDEDVVDCPTWAEVADGFARHVEGRVLVAYNAPFDFSVLRTEQQRIGLDAPAWPWLDPLVVVRQVDRFAKGKSQTEAARRRGIVLDAHGAAGDALTTAILFPRLLGELGRHRERPCPVSVLRSVDAFVAWQRETALEQERDFVAYLSTKGRGDRPGCPWHELEGVEPPEWRAPDVPAAPCPTCRAPVVTRIAQDGAITTTNSNGEPHQCREAA